MTRSRLTLAFIENKSRRKACYKKRKKGLTKKVEELTTLCGVEACVIIYSNFDEEPQIWPAEHSALMKILMKFKNLSALEQNRKMVTQESFTRQRIKRLLDQCKKLRQKNRQKEIKLFVSECLTGETQRNFSLADLTEMRWSMYFTVQAISRQIETIKGQSLVPAPAPTVSLMPNFQTSGLMIPTIRGKSLVQPEMPMNYYRNLSLRTNTVVQNEFSGFQNGYNNFVAPGVPAYYPQNPAWGMNVMLQNAQPPAMVPPGMSMNFTQKPAIGMSMVMQNEQVAGIANGYNPAVASGILPTNIFQTSTQGMTTMVQQQFGGFPNGNYILVPPEIAMDYPQIPACSMNSMVLNEHSTSFEHGNFNIAFAPAQMVVNDLENPATGINATVPHEQSTAGSSDFDWVSYLSGDKDAGTGFTCP